nr:integrase, catalytic region, zinc finger, CCHC-type, peptidase aspartic, catalytic [Tanacetum cinerariifolium]
SSPESAPTFAELFEINDLKARVQEKDIVIMKLKEKLNSFSGDVKERKVQREVEEIKTQNLELDHKVTKLKVNLKSVEVSDLNASLQEKVLVITALKEQLNKLKGKAVLIEAVSFNPIDPALLQVDVAPLVPKLRKNSTAHTDYTRHTQEEAATLREIVESERLLSPRNTSLAYACKYTRRIQELLMILQQTCPSITDLGTKLVAVTPKNKIKQIKRTAQITKSERTTVATSPSANIDSNTPVLSFTGVTLVSSASGSKSQDNTKKNRIRRTQKKAKETELEDHLRTVKSSLNKASVVDSKATSSVIKIATATIVPPREPIPIVKSTDKPVVTLVYTRKPKAKKVPNTMEPNKSWGTSSNVSSSLTDCRLGSSFSHTYLLHTQSRWSGSAYWFSGKQSVYSVPTRYAGILTNMSFVQGIQDQVLALASLLVRLKVPVRRIRTDNGTEFVNQTLRDYYEEVGISHETSVARSPQQNGVFERRNRTLIEAARTIENLGKLQPKADIRIFIGYAPSKKAFQIYNRRTRRIVETIHVNFDELIAMASEQRSSGPALNEMNPGTISSGLVQKSSSSASYVPPSRNDWDLLF